jgi:hypothetical protein
VKWYGRKFCIFQIFLLFDLPFFHIFQIFSAFNLSFVKNSENTEENCEMIWKIWMKCEMIWKKSEKINYGRKPSWIVLPYFPYLFTIRLAFLPYFPNLFTIQLTFLPYHFTIFFCIFQFFSLFDLPFFHIWKKNRLNNVWYKQYGRK